MTVGPSTKVVTGLAAVCRQQSHRTGRCHAMRRRRRTKSLIKRTQRNFRQLSARVVVAVEQFVTVEIVGHTTLCLDSRLGAKNAAQQCGNKQQAHQNPIHAIIPV